MISSGGLGGAELERVSGIISRCGNPRQVILFGSRAGGQVHEHSDIDVMVVVDDGEDEDACRRRINGALREHHMMVDVIVRTAESFERRQRDVGTLDYQVARYGRLLCHRDDVADDLGRAGRVREDLAEPGGPPSVAEWTARANNDFAVMRKILGSDRPEADIVCFHAHQGVEKLLKALLIRSNIAPPRTHDLRALVALCPRHIRDNTTVQMHCGLLQELWPRSRYPEAEMPTDSELREAALAAAALREVLLW